MPINQWFRTHQQMYFEDPLISLADNQYLIHSTRVYLFNYKLQDVLEAILVHSNVPDTEEVNQEIHFSDLNQVYIAKVKSRLGTFQHRQGIEDLSTWLRVNNLLAILSNHSPVTISPTALLTFMPAKKPEEVENLENTIPNVQIMWYNIIVPIGITKMSNQLIFFYSFILLQVEKPTLIGGLFFVIIQTECPIRH